MRGPDDPNRRQRAGLLLWLGTWLAVVVVLVAQLALTQPTTYASLCFSQPQQAPLQIVVGVLAGLASLLSFAIPARSAMRAGVATRAPAILILAVSGLSLAASLFWSAVNLSYKHSTYRGEPLDCSLTDGATSGLLLAAWSPALLLAILAIAYLVGLRIRRVPSRPRLSA